MTERYVFLFDGLIILTKQNTKRSSVTGPVGDYKLKEKFQIRKVDVADKEDSDGNIYVHFFPHTNTRVRFFPQILNFVAILSRSRSEECL